jgi:RNA polymerase sigma factor (sigma-70 family)
MTTLSSDARLVASHLAGDPSALGGIYDRYADSLHDTAAAMLNDRSDAADVLHDVILIAAERLGQLRDPDRLKPWLFAILRNEVYRRTKNRRRTIATDFSGADDRFDMVDEGFGDPEDDVTDDVAGDDLAELVRNAACGLDERDQLVLELSVRQGLGGHDLADALGVSANQSYTLVHRMRERVEKSLGAYVIAKVGRNECGDLDKLLGKWDGEFTVLIRKRVARHVDKCDTCSMRRSKVAPLAMFAGAPVYAAPASLRDRILDAASLLTAAPATAYQFTATDGFPQIVKGVRKKAAWVAPTAAASLMLVVAAISFLWLNPTDQPGTIASSALDRAIESTTTAAASTTTTTTTTEPPASTTTRLPAPTNVAKVPALPSTTLETTTTGPVGSTGPKATTAPVVTPRPTTTPATTATVTTSGPTTPATTQPAPVPTPTTSPPTVATTIPPTRGRLNVGSGSLDLGAGSGTSSGTVAVSNLGDLPVNFTVGGAPGSFQASPGSGTLAGGATATVAVSIDRANISEGSAPSGNLLITGGGDSFNVNLSASVERPPTLSGANVSAFCGATAPNLDMSAAVSINDESSISSAIVSLSGPNGLSGSTALIESASWSGSLQFPFPAQVNGTWSWTFTATDNRGNTASTGGSTAVSC